MKHSVYYIFFLLFVSNVYSQDEPNKDAQNKHKYDRLYFGGNFSIGIGSYLTMIEVSPIVGYRLTPRFSSGVGLTYIYYSSYITYNNAINPTKFTTNVYGGRIFCTFTLIKNIHNTLPFVGNTGLFLQMEPEILSLEKKYFSSVPNASGNFVQSNLWLGLGLKDYINRRASFYILMLYNVIDNPYSPYPNPNIKVGFIF